MKEKPEIVSSLSEENRQGYLKRLELNSGVVLPNPYSISEQQWANAITCGDTISTGIVANGLMSC